MKLKADLFPYPVLHTELDDYVNSKFDMEIELVEENPLEIIYNISFVLQDEGIQNMIANNLACFAARVEGKASGYSKLFKLSSNASEITISLKADEVGKRMSVNRPTNAKEDIENYSKPNCNFFYYGENFTVPVVEKGEIIAYKNTIELDFEFENRENPSARSMIQVASTDKDTMQVDISGDKIVVYLPSKDYNAYFQLSGLSDAIQHWLLVAVVLASLTYVLER